MELGCFKVEQKIFFFVNIFLSLVQIRLSRNGTTLGRKCFCTVLNFGHLAIWFDSCFFFVSKNEVTKYIQKLWGYPGQSWPDKPQFLVTLLFLTFFEIFEKQLQHRIAKCPKVDNAWKPFCPSVDPAREN